MDTTTALLQHIESLGFAVSVHRMGTYIELHAVKVPEGSPVHMSRNADGDDDREMYLAACELAEMCGMEHGDR